jgi:molybdopterin-synthase adenylyltransferase
MLKNFRYSEFTSRNYLYIPDNVQHEIQSKKIAFFGTGLSSSIAEACVRLGFMHLHLHDGDKVELSNLNRQSFEVSDLGLFKANVLKTRLLRINPLCSISVTTNYIDKLEDFEETIKNTDIIINTVDCNKTYFDIIE